MSERPPRPRRRRSGQQRNGKADSNGRTAAAGRQNRNDPACPPGEGPVLVTLVGDEPLAPLVLARHLHAARVICLALPVVEWRVEPLLAILRQHGCATSWISVRVVDVPSGVQEIEQRLGLSAADSVVFDLTNARGVFGIALYELAHRREREAPDRTRLVRMDWSDRVLRSISPDQTAAEPLRAVVGLADYLGVHGKLLLGHERGPASTSPFGEAARRLARSIPLARPLLSAVHRGAVDHPLRIARRRGMARLVDELAADGVLERRDSAIFATSVQAFQFLHGRWLEEYLFEVADASGRFDDCASGVRFRWTFAGEERAGGVPEVANEIDFAGIAGGRATLASCKTGGRDVNGALYELLTLAERAAGRSVVAVFATTDTLDRPARHRAAALGIRVLDATRLPDPNIVLQMLFNGAPPLTAPAQPPPAPKAARPARTRRRRRTPVEASRA